MNAKENEFPTDTLLSGQIVRATSMEQWQEAQDVAAENDKFVLAGFGNEFCRKCMAIAPRFQKLPLVLADKDLAFLSVECSTIGKEAVKE